MAKKTLTQRNKPAQHKGMGPLADLPAPFEDLVLLAIANYPEDISGPTLQELLTDATGYPVTSGSLYGTIRRMEAKRWITSWPSDGRNEETGKSRRYLKLTVTGRDTVNRMLKVRARIADLAQQAGRG